METINIEIPDNLSRIDEVLRIAKHLGKKMLPSNDIESIKSIGSGYTIKELNTVINIKRTSTEKTLITYTCSICNTIFDKKSSKLFYTNYGGKIKTNRICSENCRTKYMAFLPSNRCSISKKKLTEMQVNQMFSR